MPPVDGMPNIDVSVTRKLRPEEAPDVDISGFAGHCGPLCNMRNT
jgi:hypothetical protein